MIGLAQSVLLGIVTVVLVVVVVRMISADRVRSTDRRQPMRRPPPR